MCLQKTLVLVYLCLQSPLCVCVSDTVRQLPLSLDKHTKCMPAIWKVSLMPSGQVLMRLVECWCQMLP